jgi:hypothetical protein
MQSQELRKTLNNLPDTGQNTGYTTIFGEDADYSVFPPNYSDMNNGSVLDNITGLQWQKIDAGEMTHEQATLYADTCTLAGFTDWRLPSPLEAYSIILFSRNKPPLDITFFPNTTAEYWWTHSVQHNDSSKVWVTNAGGGIGNHSKKETISAGGTKKFHTRLVRDSKSPPIIQAPYVRTDYGSIIDLRTNLEWFTIPSQDSLTWEQGLQYAEQFSAGTHDDWHMPNIKELFSLTDQNYSFPAIDPKFGIITQNTNYWSSTTLSNQTDKAWYMDSRYGITTYAVKSQRLPVIVVRNTHATTSLEQHSPQSTVYTHENVISITINHPQNSIHIFDILGNRILSDSTQSHEWHSPTLSIGLYIIHLVDGNTIQSFKAVILP